MNLGTMAHTSITTLQARLNKLGLNTNRRTDYPADLVAAPVAPPIPFNTAPSFPLSIPSGYATTTPTNSPHIHLLNLFYKYFYPSHPFLLSKKHLEDWLPKGKLNHLQAAISYIGSCYDKDLTSQRSSLRVAIDFTIFVQHPLRDGYLVQTLLLYALGLHANDERSRASQILNMTIDLALELGMNGTDYARTHNEGYSVVEESWRRTWWELYFIDGELAAAD